MSTPTIMPLPRARCLRAGTRVAALFLAMSATAMQDGSSGRATEPDPQPEVPPASATAQEPAATAPEASAGGGRESATDAGATATGAAPATAPAQDRSQGSGYRSDRRTLDEGLVPCNFTNQPIESLYPIIVEYTGKTVLPIGSAVRTEKVSILNDKLVTKSQALELIFQALRLNNIGIVETPEFIMLDTLTNASKLQPITVLGPANDVMRMADNGQFVTKVWQVRNTKASAIFDRINASLPDYAKIEVDNSSNQLILEGDVGLCKRTQELISILDVPPFQDIRTETFRLRYADAQTIGTVIQELFSASRSGGGASSAANRNSGNRGNPRAATPGETAQVGTSESLLVSVIPATNSITIRAEPEIMKDITGLIRDVWDIDPQRDGSLFRTYQLKHTDPLKVQDILQNLLGSGGGSASGNRPGQGGRVAGAQGGGGETGATAAVENIFQIEAYPDSNRLVILSKTPDNFAWLDRMIEELDQPVLAGAPRVVELKYASALEVSEIVNAILAPPGAQASISAPEEGLSGIDFATAGSGSSSDAAGTTGSGQQIQFPWQARTGGANQDPQAEVSALIGKSRIVPNAGQNSLLVLAPPEIADALVAVIKELDRPGRQVMILVTLAEVELGDQFAMGIKFGPTGTVNPSNSTDSILASTETVFDRDNMDFPKYFTNFVFGGTINADIVLQALAQKTSVRILQEPKIFTSDNQEAKFFIGQDVPFQEGATSDAAGTTSSFAQVPVGIGLNVRPRITADGHVAMEVEVLLSNVNTTSAQSLQAGGNPVIDRRQTNTTVTVKDGQTMVLSGVRIETENKQKDGIPILGDLPILDLIFGSVDNVSSVKELLIFLQPIVQETPDTMGDLNAEDLERLEALRKKLTDETKKKIFQGRAAPRDVDPTPAPPAVPVESAPAASSMPSPSVPETPEPPAGVSHSSSR
ncbi:MAG: hypothetical protein O2819_01175 [Planctomycetota bacterium]|nr:hypothetical protein [Planctomycetota bacterium]MDA1105606.1 hypothetical protein [Planctomycetota bacterium]